LTLSNALDVSVSKHLCALAVLQMYQGVYKSTCLHTHTHTHTRVYYFVAGVNCQSSHYLRIMEVFMMWLRLQSCGFWCQVYG